MTDAYQEAVRAGLKAACLDDAGLTFVEGELSGEEGRCLATTVRLSAVLADGTEFMLVDEYCGWRVPIEGTKQGEMTKRSSVIAPEDTASVMVELAGMMRLYLRNKKQVKP